MFGLLAPRCLVVLAAHGDEKHDANTETKHSAERGELLRGPDVRVDEAEVLGDGVGDGCVCGVGSPGEEGGSGCEVLGYGFLGEDVFPGCQGFLYVVWLGEDGEAVVN